MCFAMNPTLMANGKPPLALPMGCTEPTTLVPAQRKLPNRWAMKSSALCVLLGRRGAVPNCVNLAQASMATHLLVVRHKDEVGVLAGVLDRLRKATSTFKRCRTSFFKGSAAACAHIQVSHAPAHHLIEELQQQSFVLAVDVVNWREHETRP